MLAAVLGVAAHLVGSATGLSNARAQTEPSAALPDSALEALRGRGVRVGLRSGLEAVGELAAFDVKTLTVVTADGKLMVLKRTDVGSVAVASSAAAPAPSAEPPLPAPELPPSVPAPAPVAPPPAPVLASLAPPPASAGPNDGERQGSGMRMLIAGSVLAGAGAILDIIGGIVLANATRALECDFDACYATTPPEEIVPAGVLLFFGTASLLTAAVVAPIGAVRRFGGHSGADTVGVQLGPGRFVARWSF